MIKVALAVYLVLLVLSLLIYKKWSSPFVFFNLIWSLWLTIAGIGVKGISTAGREVFLYFIIGGIVFNLAGFLFVLMDSLKYSRKGIKIKPESKIQPYLDIIFVVIQCVVLAYYVFKAIDVWQTVITGGSYEDVRGYYYSSENFGSRIEYLLVTFVFDPMTTLGAVVFAINIFDKKKSNLTLGIILMNIFLRALVSAGRMIIFELAILVLVNFLYKYKELIKKNKKKVLKPLFIVLIGVAIAVFITEGRNKSEPGTSRAIINLLSNFTGSFTYFSILNSNGIYVSQQYGRIFFGGIIDTFLMVSNRLGLTNIPYITNEVGVILSDFYNIGSISYNAMPTMYYYFISDFGEIGIVIGCIIFAFYASFMYCRCNRKKTQKTFALYMIMMLVVMESSMTWLPFKLSFFITLVYTCIFISNKPIYETKDKKKEIDDLE